ncbi:MAG: redox-regulated ATPase YchF [Leptospirales bacterium]|nr:redox-regulated ATPase YchF [Leptospirales bacterium]
MSLRCGIVGLPNVGKSTIFNAITRAGAQSANYPFCTIEPNVGRVDVPDSRLLEIAARVKPKRIVPTYTEFVDIAGLVEGASKGEGLGNKFLAHIRETQAVAHVVRCFEDENIIHVRGGINPLDDIRIINLELILADLDSLEKQMDRLEKRARGQDKEAAAGLETGRKIRAALEAEQPARSVELSVEEAALARQFQMLTARPALYVANVDEGSAASGNALTELVEQFARKEGAPVVRICGRIEEEVASLEESDARDYLASMGLEEPGLNRMIRTSYELLDLITFFTAGEEEVRAWTVQKGALAPEAAAEIHSDIQRGFIRAETTSYNDFLAAGSLSAARDAGKMRLEGKEYVVQDGDIIYFRFNV